MSRHIPRRILASALFSVGLAGVLIVFGLNLIRPTIERASMANALGAIDIEGCIADPAAFGWRSGALSIFAYDRTGRSANRAAPAIEPALLRQAQDSGDLAHAATATGIVSVIQRAPDGPCAVIRLTGADARVVARPRILLVLGAATVGGMLLAVVGALWFVVWPLRARINALAASARGVGGPDFVPQPGGPDALGHIADVLTRSHQRVIETRDALEARNRALEDHLAGIAHDLRTPLASMQLALEVLAAESAEPLRQEARRALADGVYLSSLVENLHQATRLRHAADVTAGEVELAELVRRLEQRFAIIGRHADIAVAAHAPDTPVPAACTPALAERAVANLIQNAVEHNPGPGHVAITLAVDGGRFVLTVADDGPGLPAGTLARLDADTFLLDDARSRGPGLGMLITAEVARRAGWALRYAPLEPTGLKATLEGPITGSPPAADG